MTIRTDEMLPATRAGYAALQTWLANQGIRVTLADFGGFRTQSDTTLILEYRQNDYAADVRAGRVDPTVTSIDEYRPIAPYGSSYHDYGAAFDIIPETPYPSGMTYDSILRLAGSHAPTLGLVWGGTFHNQDVRHFQLDMSLADAEAKWNAYAAGGSDVTGSPYGSDITTGGDIAGSGGGFTTGATLAVVAIVAGILYALRRKLGLRP